jgi:hypothetical protein
MFTWEIRSKADILPTTQGIYRRMAAKDWISCSLSIVHLLQYFRVPNLGCDLICHFKKACQSQTMRWVKNAALSGEEKTRQKL